MSAEEVSMASGEEPRQLTNKEKRLARKAEKQADKAAALASTTDHGDSRKRKAEVSEHDETAAVESNEIAADDEEAEAEEEAEALSHKEQRKRRKLEKQQAARQRRGGEDEQEGTVPFTTTKTPALPQRSPFSLWVGNLSFNTSMQRLQEWFEEHDVSGISRVHMPKGIRKMEHNRGFAYVDVPSSEAMKAGIALSELNLDGRRLLIKAGSDFGGRPNIDPAAKALAEGRAVMGLTDAGDADEASGDDEAASGGDEKAAPAGAVRKGKTGLTKTAQKILRAQKNPPGPTLFIGNLSFNATEESVRDMLERSAKARNEAEASKADAEKARRKEKDGGKAEASVDPDADDGRGKEDTTAVAAKPLLRGAGIRKVRMGEFEDSGKCKGFGFVDFHNAAYATAALIDPRNSHLDGRELSVQYAGAEAIRRGAPKGQGRGPPGTESYAQRRFGAGDGVRGDRPDRRPIRPARVVDTAEREALAESAPTPGTFDAEAPVEKKHKETKEERIARREKAAAADGHRARRLKPGAALASAPRGKTAIDMDAPKGQKKTFDDE